MEIFVLVADAAELGKELFFQRVEKREVGGHAAQAVVALVAGGGVCGGRCGGEGIFDDGLTEGEKGLEDECVEHAFRKWNAELEIGVGVRGARVVFLAEAVEGFTADPVEKCVCLGRVQIKVVKKVSLLVAVQVVKGVGVHVDVHIDDVIVGVEAVLAFSIFFEAHDLLVGSAGGRKKVGSEAVVHGVKFAVAGFGPADFVGQAEEEGGGIFVSREVMMRRDAVGAAQALDQKVDLVEFEEFAAEYDFGCLFIECAHQHAVFPPGFVVRG